VRVLDQSKAIAKWVNYCGDLDAPTDLDDWIQRLGTQLNQTGMR
jgi:hypothetical protein